MMPSICSSDMSKNCLNFQQVLQEEKTVLRTIFFHVRIFSLFPILSQDFDTSISQFIERIKILLTTSDDSRDMNRLQIKPELTDISDTCGMMKITYYELVNN